MAIIVLAVVCLVLGAANGDGELIALAVLCLVAGLPLIRLDYRLQTKAAEQVARKRSAS